MLKVPLIFSKTLMTAHHGFHCELRHLFSSLVMVAEVILHPSNLQTEFAATNCTQASGPISGQRNGDNEKIMAEIYCQADVSWFLPPP